MSNGVVQTGKLPETAGDLIAQGETVRQIQTQYITAVAVQRPRSLTDIQRRCLEEAELAGDSFFYGWKTKTTDERTGEVKEGRLEGPSKELALCAVRNYGNAVVQQRPVIETPTAWIFTAAFIDLETGFTIERQYRMDKKFPVYGKMDEFRKTDIRFQIGQTKAIRNVVLNAVPAGLVDRMMETSKKSVRMRIEKEVKEQGIEKVRERVIQSLLKSGVDPDKVVKKLGAKVEQWDLEILTLLYGDLKALKNGEETPESLYGDNEEATSQATGNGGALNTASMSAGDPASHQGHEASKKEPEAKKRGEKSGGNLGF